jgi:hypothetical protein
MGLARASLIISRTIFHGDISRFKNICDTMVFDGGSRVPFPKASLNSFHTPLVLWSIFVPAYLRGP